MNVLQSQSKRAPLLTAAAARCVKTFESLESRRLLSDTPGSTVPPPVPPGGASLHGTVFRDLNNDGVRQNSEAGQPNIRVYLDYNNNGTRDGDAEPIALTDSSGAYHFTNANAPATIAVRLLLTGTNFLQTRPANDAARTVTTTPGATYELESFGVNETVPPVPPANTVLSGVVYTDLNHNGHRDNGETGRAGVNVYIDTNNDNAHEDGEPLAKTNGDGVYTFSGLSGGDVTLRLLLTGTHLQQTDPADNKPVLVSVVPSHVTQAAPFGVVEISVTPAPSAIVRGTVFYDTNQDGQRQSTEGGRAYVHVYLDLNNDAKYNPQEPVAITNAQGGYSFNTAPIRNDLHIRLDLAGTNLKQTFPTDNAARVLTTVAGQTYSDQNFGVHEVPVVPPPTNTGTIRGRVFFDANQDGHQQTAEHGVANVRVYLDLNHNGTHQDGEPLALTNALGNYVFEKVPAGTYDVRLIRGGFTQTSPPDNGANVAVVTAGGNVGDLFFGVYASPTVHPTLIGVTPPRGDATGVTRGTGTSRTPVASDVLA